MIQSVTIGKITNHYFHYDYLGILRNPRCSKCNDSHWLYHCVGLAMFSCQILSRFPIISIDIVSILFFLITNCFYPKPLGNASLTVKLYFNGLNCKMFGIGHRPIGLLCGLFLICFWLSLAVTEYITICWQVGREYWTNDSLTSLYTTLLERGLCCWPLMRDPVHQRISLHSLWPSDGDGVMDLGQH